MDTARSFENFQEWLKLARPAPGPVVRRRASGGTARRMPTTATLPVDGTFPIDDFNEQFKRSLPIEDYHTIGGFVFGMLGRAPEPGDEVAHDGCRFKVLEVEGSRIERLEIELTPEPPTEHRLEEAS